MPWLPQPHQAQQHPFWPAWTLVCLSDLWHSPLREASPDFKDPRLDGVVVVGLGLPPPSLARDQLATYFNAQAGEGFGQLVAYTQPALVKILQAAGRLIRAPEDRGILCLVDPRFPSVQSFFPAHWQVRIVPAREVKKHVREFWSR